MDHVEESLVSQPVQVERGRRPADPYGRRGLVPADRATSACDVLVEAPSRGLVERSHGRDRVRFVGTHGHILKQASIDGSDRSLLTSSIHSFRKGPTMTTHSPRLTPSSSTATVHDLRDPGYQAFFLLRTVFTVAPILFGLDKFTNLLVDWDAYLAPVDQRPRPGHGQQAMYAVGVVEVLAGLRSRSRRGSAPGWSRPGWAGSSSTCSPSRGSTTWPCATSGCWSPPSRWPVWPTRDPVAVRGPGRTRLTPQLPGSPTRAAPSPRMRGSTRRARAGRGRPPGRARPGPGSPSRRHPAPGRGGVRRDAHARATST